MTDAPKPSDPADARATLDAQADGGFQPRGLRGFQTPAELIAWADAGGSLTAAEARALAALARRGLPLSPGATHG